MACVPGTCSCCSGTDVETPARIENLAGQSAIRYRIGVHATFRESLLARLSSVDAGALASLQTRDDQDFTIALCDALATTLDVLSFYQERIANEHYLRTATERRSILELARLIGYRSAPGCAASTWLAFTLQPVPGTSSDAGTSVTLAAGTRAQSVPGPEETAQAFETTEDIEARAEWSAIPVQASIAWRPKFGDTDLYLEGVGHNLIPGDVILIVGKERLDYYGSERWDVRLLTAVEADVASERTRLVWETGLGEEDPKVHPAAEDVHVYVFRQRAAFFGHNAPDPRLLQQSAQEAIKKDLADWLKVFRENQTIDLDAAYPKIVPESWFVLVANQGPINRSGLTGYVELCRVTQVAFPSVKAFGMSGKVTRLSRDILEFSGMFEDLQSTTVLAQTEELPAAARPLLRPLYGSTIAFERIVEGLSQEQALSVRGKAARVRRRPESGKGTLELAPGVTRTVEAGNSLRVAAAPEVREAGAWRATSPEEFERLVLGAGSRRLRLTLVDRDDERGTMEVLASDIALAAPEDDDPELSEVVLVSPLAGSVTVGRDRTTVTLEASLKNCYDLAGTRVCANVTPATQGETVREILGNGDARVPNATFDLLQKPLTWIRASTATGVASTLVLRVNDLQWREVDSLFETGATERVYELSTDDEGATTVRFGDGVEGARPPSGDHNVRAEYRKGLGIAGNVAAGSITTLLSRPLGVTAVVNPEAATGGEDAETETRARVNAPFGVLTLGRAVSVRDYQDVARAYAGLAKAHAIWIPSGPGRGVFVSVAAEGGAVVGRDVLDGLLEHLHDYGDALMPVRIRDHRAVSFAVRVAVKVAADADAPIVLADVREGIEAAFAFDARDFGQMVSTDEIIAVAHATSGVEAVQGSDLRRTDGVVGPGGGARLFAELPIASPFEVPQAAELISLDPTRLTVEAMA
jgi:baseplate J-like protein